MENEELRLFCDLVCSVLTDMDRGSRWELQEDAGGRWTTAKNVNSEYECIWFEMVGRENKIHVCAHWPSVPVDGNKTEILSPYRPYGHTGSWYEMNVSAKRKPADVANAIIGRLLLDYRKTLNELLEKHKKTVKYIQDREALFNKVRMEYFPAFNYHSGNGSTPEINFPYGEIAGIDSGEINFHGPDRVELKITMTDNHLYLTVLDVLQGWIQEHKEKVSNA